MPSLFDSLSTFIHQNAVFSGGLALTVWGSILAGLYKVPQIVWPILRRKFVAQLEFSNDDPAYHWILAWLSQNPYLKQTKHLRVLSTTDDPDNEAAPKAALQPLYSIPPGLHWFVYKNRLVWIVFSRSRIAGSRTPSYAEDISISSLFAPQSFVLSIVAEAKTLFDKKDSSNLTIYIPDSWGERWAKLTSRPIRPLSSLVYDENIGFQVLEDLKQFTDLRKWYTDMGIPWRRGYLLHGVPGGGKTTLITALAGELSRDIYVLNLSKPDLSDDGLIRLMNQVPSGAFLVIEEVDCLFNGRESKNEKQTLTFSGVLTAIDGIASAEGRILFMTTNHLEKLDPALIRPGRADIHVAFGNASAAQIIKLVARFFPTTDIMFITKFVNEQVPKEKFSIAKVQEILVTHRDSCLHALEALKTLDTGG